VLAGIDPISGEVKWRNWYEETPPWGGSLTTPTGVTFAGDGDDLFTASETETGQPLASWDLGTAASGAPVSWYDPGEGKQYVAAPAGGERENYTESGNRFVVFALRVGLDAVFLPAFRRRPIAGAVPLGTIVSDDWIATGSRRTLSGFRLKNELVTDLLPVRQFVARRVAPVRPSRRAGGLHPLPPPSTWWW